MDAFFQDLGTAWNAVLFCIGIALLTRGATWFTDAAVFIAKITHIPKMIIGATIVSLATTFPEFCVSGLAAATGQTDTSMGNAVGSVLCNTGLIIGASALFGSIATNRRLLLGNGAFMVGGGVAVVALSLGGTLGRPAGLGLLLGLVAFVLYSVHSARGARSRALAAVVDDVAPPDPDETECPRRALRRHLLLFAAGALAVGAGSTLLVGNGKPIATALGISPLLVALTFTAVGTSLPELITSVTAAMKGHADMAVGNVMGANALNMLWVLGASSVIRPIAIRPQTRSLDFPFMLGLTVLLVAFGWTHARLKRWEGGALVAIYIVYLVLATRWNVAR